MVLEDYAELMFLQTVLKKLGFDVDGIQNPRALEESVLRMNPEILIMTAFGKKLNGFELARSVRKSQGIPKIILLRALGAPLSEELGIDGWLESPTSAVSLIEKIAEIGNLDKQTLTDKFARLHMSEPTALPPSSITPKERQSRYDKILLEKPPEIHGFASRQVSDQVKQLRQMETTEASQDLEAERKAFVTQLFRKKA